MKKYMCISLMAFTQLGYACNGLVFNASQQAACVQLSTGQYVSSDMALVTVAMPLCVTAIQCAVTSAGTLASTLTEVVAQKQFEVIHPAAESVGFGMDLSAMSKLPCNSPEGSAHKTCTIDNVESYQTTDHHLTGLLCQFTAHCADLLGKTTSGITYYFKAGIFGEDVRVENCDSHLVPRYGKESDRQCKDSRMAEYERKFAGRPKGTPRNLWVNRKKES